MRINNITSTKEQMLEAKRDISDVKKASSQVFKHPNIDIQTKPRKITFLQEQTESALLAKKILNIK